MYRQQSNCHGWHWQCRTKIRKTGVWVFVNRASKHMFLKGEREWKCASWKPSGDPVSPLIHVLGLTASHCILYISPVVTKHRGDMQPLITIMDFFPSVGFDLQAQGQILPPLLLPAVPSNQPYFTHTDRAPSAAAPAGSGAEFLTPVSRSNMQWLLILRGN